MADHSKMAQVFRKLLGPDPSALAAWELQEKAHAAQVRENERLGKANAELEALTAELKRELLTLRERLAKYENRATNPLEDLSPLARNCLLELVRHPGQGLGVPEPALAHSVGAPHRSALDLALEELQERGLAESPGGQMGTYESPGFSSWCATSDGKRAVIEAGLLED